MFYQFKAMKPTIPEVMPMICEYRDTEGNGVGGSLHIVLDDGNVEDHFVSRCVEEAEKKGDVAGANLGRTLLKMSKTQRRKISANFYS